MNTPHNVKEWSASYPKEIRKKLDLTQEQLAKILGVETITVSSWEQGSRTPRLAQRKHLALIERAIEE
jgi:DNA-binding transcriptional regulator YiaG